MSILKVDSLSTRTGAGLINSANKIAYPGGMLSANSFRSTVGEVAVANGATATLLTASYTTSGNSKLMFLYNSSQILRSSVNQNPRLFLYVDNTYVSDQVDTDHIGYGFNHTGGGRQQLMHTAITGVLAAGTHTIRLDGGCYSESGSVTYNYQVGSQGQRCGQLFVWEIAQ